MRGRGSHERPRSRTPQRRSRCAPHPQLLQARARGRESGGETRVSPSSRWTPRRVSRSSVRASAARCSRHGTTLRQTSQGTQGRRTPPCGSRTTISFAGEEERSMMTSSSATFPCPWPTRHGHGSSTCLSTEFTSDLREIFVGNFQGT
jgi:hypothetical protein